MNIQYLKRSEIDVKKWNTTVEQHGNGFPYAFSWYLDIVSEENWSALISDDYKIIMPFASNQKLFGVHQIYPPFFTQQLGLISNKPVPKEVITQFLEAIPSKFKRINYALNFSNKIEGSNFATKANYCLSLSPSFEEIQKAFSKNLKRNLKRAKTLGVKFGEPLSVDEHLIHFEREMSKKKAGVSKKHIELLRKLINTSIKKEKGYIKTAYDQNGELLASTFLLNSPTRIINLILWSNLKGKQQFATHYLLSQIMKENAKTDKIFDFEGSNIPTIADFNRKFGATDFPYPIYKVEKLPFWVSGLLKLKGNS